MNTKISIVITVKNEEGSIGPLLDSLINQSRAADEILVVDGNSVDETVKMARECGNRVRVVVKKTSRAEGRNVGVRLAKHGIIVMTDADCVADGHWLARIVKPFENKKVEMVAGFYSMVAKTHFQRAAARFIGIVPQRFSKDFLPSTRSVAFRRGLWRRVGGFPEGKSNLAEDTDFNYQVVKKGGVIVRVKNAIVYWQVPSSVRETLRKFYWYAYGDARSRIWWHPVKKFGSHNIKAVFIILRYICGIVFVALSFRYLLLLLIVILGFLIYCFWAFWKVYSCSKDIKAGGWGVILQIGADMAVSLGFILGFVG